MMESICTRASTALSSFWRKPQRAVGFQERYNFVLWSIFALGLLGFTLSRSMYLNYYGIFCRRSYLAANVHAAPGECYYFLNGGREQIGMMLHLFAIIPCCLLLFFQFVPSIRQRFTLFHRVNGYIIILLALIAVAGGLTASRRSFGGDPIFRASNVLLSGMVVVGLSMAMVNIKRLRVDQHRAWMLRTWVWASSVITMRIIQNVASRMVSGRGYAAMRPCAQIDSDGVLPAAVVQEAWPECAAYFSGANPSQQALVGADYHGLPAEINVALSIVSGVSALLALSLHVIGVEIYLHMTPAETERLRQVSYHKQLAANSRHPRHGSTAVDCFEDAAKWSPYSNNANVTPGGSSDEEARELQSDR